MTMTAEVLDDELFLVSSIGGSVFGVHAESCSR